MDEIWTLAVDWFRLAAMQNYRCTRCEAWLDWTDPAFVLELEDDETTNDEFHQELDEFRARAEMIWHLNGHLPLEPRNKMAAENALTPQPDRQPTHPDHLSRGC